MPISADKKRSLRNPQAQAASPELQATLTVVLAPSCGPCSQDTTHLRSRHKERNCKYPSPPRNSTPRPRMAADCKTLPKPPLTDNIHSGLQQKGKNHSSANLSPRRKMISVPVPPLRPRPASCVGLRLWVEGKRSYCGKARPGRSFTQVKFY